MKNDVRLEKRASLGVDEYFHFIILALSIGNVIKVLPGLVSYFTWLEIISILWSVFGGIVFYEMYKGRKQGKLLAYIWLIPQIVILAHSSGFGFDFSQGIALPFSFSYSGYTSAFYFGINFIPIVLLVSLYLIPKNNFYLPRFNVKPLNVEGCDEFNAKIIKSYDFDQEHRVLVFNQGKNGCYYGIQIKKAEQFSYNDSSDKTLDDVLKKYLLVEIKKEVLKNESFRRYEFKPLGEAHLEKA